MIWSARRCAFASASLLDVSPRKDLCISSPSIASRDKYSGTGGPGQPLSRIRFAGRATTLTNGEGAAASGAAAAPKRGATGKPVVTVALVTSGEDIRAVVSRAEVL